MSPPATPGGRLPPTAWMIRSLGRWIESRPFPSALRDRDEPGTVSRAALVGVFLAATAIVAWGKARLAMHEG